MLSFSSSLNPKSQPVRDRINSPRRQRANHSAGETDHGGLQAKFTNLFHRRLKGALLICHGMVDTNVNFQDTVRLVEKLIELRKDNWQVAPYPAEDHGFDREASWADEYKRILKLFTDNLHPDSWPVRQKATRAKGE